ncbi:heterokaryon incompatibility protein-domain-containing protein [Dactylonectria estremocensis]|uniref:Heterokaryon incompatibility protein-domain-containing protein n=1 Tax=Dactylonectria estremocensis TaxID=1079267 RepID=A0A9P9E9X5_9HYPO|nr:heterokaryon incompatibility protein-domain-containing protein [Dactylonectria estremocensis]
MFPYEPFESGVDALRLLVLLPRSSPKDKGINCELHNRAFGSKPAYEALSYTWGTQPATKTIAINGQPFLVRSNLYSALQALRLKKKPRALWVDAICINQDDMAERNWQVSLMAFVYTRAERVLAWLGTSPPNSQSGFFSDEQWYAMSHNPYWTRLWIIQELVLAHEVVFCLGNNSFDWERVQSTMNPEWRALEGRSNAIKKLRDERYTSARRLENLVEQFRKAQCTEKRDKIYGFLGLVYDRSDKAITVDYKIGFAQLYAQVIRFHQATPAPSDSPFSADIDRAVKLVKFSQLIQSILGDAVAEEAQSKTGVDWPKTLYTARGFIAGEIILLGPTPTEIVSSVRSDKAWRQAISEAYRESSELQQVRNTYAAFSQTILSWDERRLGKIKELYSKFSFGYRLGAGEEDSQFGKDGTVTADAPEARLFVGTKSLLGVAPPNARIGDLICTFLGSNVTLVLRKVAETEDRYMFVGRAERFREETDDSNGDSDVEYGMERDFGELTIEERQHAAEDASFQNFISLKIDLETLQKLSA